MIAPIKRLLAVSALVIAGTASANDISNRANHWETTLQLRQSNSESWSFDNGSSVKLDSELGWGLGFAYNLNPNFSLGFDFSSANIDYSAQTIGRTSGSTVSAKGTAYVSTFGINGTYYLFDRALTPYITGKVGSTYIDTGIPAGLPVTECYWYWYSYVCGSYQETKSAYEMTYGGGIGVRWEANRSFFLKGGVDRTYIDVNTASGTPKLDNWRLDLGLRF